MATDWEGLLPKEVATSILSATQEASVVLGLGVTRPMGTGVQSVPLVKLAPDAAFVARGERKPYAKIEWSADELVAEEIACVAAVADADIADAGPNLEANVEAELAAAIGRALDAAVLFGVEAPASYPAGGIVSGTPVMGADALEALDGALAAVEGQGVLPDGIAAGVAINSALRQAYIAAAALPSEAVTPNVFGVPVRVTTGWDSSKGDALVGGFQFLQIGVRQDITVETSQEAVLLDDQGDIAVSAWQDDQTLIRCHARFGVAVGTPVGPGGDPVEPFALADWTA
jgi:HK97 family phage major capsid protein